MSDDKSSSSSSDEEFSHSELGDSEEFEDSMAEEHKKKESEFKNQPYDMALEVSASMDAGADAKNLMTATGNPMNLGGNDSDGKGREGTKVANAKHDEEFEVSASLAESALDVDMSKLIQKPVQGAMANQPFDEEVTVSDDEASMDTRVIRDRQAAQAKGGPGTNLGAAVAAPSAEAKGPSPGAATGQGGAAAAAAGAGGGKPGGGGGGGEETESSSSSESEDGDEAEESTATVKVEGAYDPNDYLTLHVSADVKELFQYITRFKPQEPDLETALRPFVPDYIPSVGEMDVFLKVPRPDGAPDEMGLKVLDEPATTQTDATVLELQLRALSKKQHGDVAVRAIEDAHKRPDAIQKWVDNINDLHKSKPPAEVTYKDAMPDIEALMEIWPDEVEEALQDAELPGTDLDLNLEEYARVLCALLDIPVHSARGAAAGAGGQGGGGGGGGGVAESLHVLFTLFQEFRSNQHFMGFGGGAGGPAGAKDNGPSPNPSRGGDMKLGGYEEDFSHK